MRKKAADNVTFGKFEDLFGSGDGSQEIVQLPIAEMHPFRDHPFRVADDAKMEETVQSIREQGVIVPGIVRPRDGGGYEIISGHRRRRACELAGVAEMPVYIRNMTDREAVQVMVDSNIQREDILPSEKARAYRMKYEAMKSPGIKGNSLMMLGEAAGESGKTVQRYIWLSRLNDGLLSMVDSRRLGMAQGIDLSFLSMQQQGMVLDFLEESQAKMSMAQSAKVKELAGKGELTRMALELVLAEDRPKPRRFVLDAEKISEYFPADATEEMIEETILELLEQWKTQAQ